MIKDTFFSWSRFMNLCRQDIVENWRNYVLRLAMMYGVMAIALVWSGYFVYRYSSGGSEGKFVALLFMWGFWGFGLLSASFTMEKMKSKTGRLSTLMLPATPFEKFFSRWLVFTVLFLATYLFVFRMADCTKALIYSIVYPGNTSVCVIPLFQLIENQPHNPDLGILIAAYFFFQSCFVLGSSIWPKNSFIKTIAAGVVIFMSYFLVVGFVVMVTVSGHFSSFPSIPDKTITHIYYAVAIAFTLLNWVLAYFRFKESEIINRM